MTPADEYKTGRVTRFFMCRGARAERTKSRKCGIQHRRNLTRVSLLSPPIAQFSCKELGVGVAVRGADVSPMDESGGE